MSFDGDTHDYRIGLAVMDIQTLHRGHSNLLNEIRMACGRAIIGIGSVRKSGTPGHPFTFEQRREMVRMVHGEFFDCIALDDIDAGHDIRAWYSYVKSKIKQAGLPMPSDYFSGSRIDAKWYVHEFCDPVHVAGTAYPSSITYENPSTTRRLHIVDRTALGLPSGREIRLLIETRDDEWKKYVPQRLHGYIETNYPPHLRQPLKSPKVTLKRGDQRIYLDEILNPQEIEKEIIAGSVDIDVRGRHPVGTRLHSSSMAAGSLFPHPYDLIFELKDDGRWRPQATQDEKAEWARANSA